MLIFAPMFPSVCRLLSLFLRRTYGLIASVHTAFLEKAFLKVRLGQFLDFAFQIYETNSVQTLHCYVTLIPNMRLDTMVICVKN